MQLKSFHRGYRERKLPMPASIKEMTLAGKLIEMTDEKREIELQRLGMSHEDYLALLKRAWGKTSPQTHSKLTHY
jgi:hypothetical protein